jgi:hypothetical protein
VELANLANRNMREQPRYVLDAVFEATQSLFYIIALRVDVYRPLPSLEMQDGSSRIATPC